MRPPLADRLRDGTPLVGTVLTLPGATTAEALAAPFDVVWIDLEHGALGPRDAQEMLIGAQAAGAYALTRVPAGEPGLITAMLDAGADGLVLPDISDPHLLAATITRTRLPPAGTRGYGPRRLALRDHASAAPSVWVQIERAEGADRAAEIAGVDGVDALIVGLADLSFNVGTPLEVDSAAVAHAVRSVHLAATAQGVAFGVAGPLQEHALTLAADARIAVLGTDARLSVAAMDQAAAVMRHGLAAAIVDAVEPQVAAATITTSREEQTDR